MLDRIVFFFFLMLFMSIFNINVNQLLFFVLFL